MEMEKKIWNSCLLLFSSWPRIKGSWIELQLVVWFFSLFSLLFFQYPSRMIFLPIYSYLNCIPAFHLEGCWSFFEYLSHHYLADDGRVGYRLWGHYFFDFKYYFKSKYFNGGFVKSKSLMFFKVSKSTSPNPNSHPQIPSYKSTIKNYRMVLDHTCEMKWQPNFLIRI